MKKGPQVKSHEQEYAKPRYKTMRLFGSFDPLFRFIFETIVDLTFMKNVEHLPQNPEVADASLSSLIVLAGVSAGPFFPRIDLAPYFDMSFSKYRTSLYIIVKQVMITKNGIIHANKYITPTTFTVVDISLPHGISPNSPSITNHPSCPDNVVDCNQI